MVWHKQLELEVNVRDEDEKRRALQQMHKDAEFNAHVAAQTGDKYGELMAEADQYYPEEDWRRAARVAREAIALKPDYVWGYVMLGKVLQLSGYSVDSAKWFLKAMERYPVGSDDWASITAQVLTRCKTRGAMRWSSRRGGTMTGGEGCVGGSKCILGTRYAGPGVEWTFLYLARWVSLGSGAREGGRTLRRGCNAVQRSGNSRRTVWVCRPMPQEGKGHIDYYLGGHSQSAIQLLQ